jgi:uncharacterized protein (DUF302 family)
MNEPRYPSREAKAALLISATLSLTILFAGVTKAMAEPMMTQRTLQIEHIKIETPKKFADVESALESSVPKLDRTMLKTLAAGDEQATAKLEQGHPLFIFLKRDHGVLLQIAGRRREALQYDIGNPHTASKMTRHRLPAGLYAPLRVILYEDDKGDTVAEYDRPSSLFGQFNDEAVSALARELDDALENALRRAME